jgi:E-phenylitaconyl-CoA hydratase
VWDHLHNPQFHRGLELYKPVIAAVNGHCHAGGLNLMLACDIRIVADHARFSLALVRRGIVPANGGTQRLPRQLPYAIAMEMLLYGTAIDAATAAHFGLVNKVVPLAELRATALDYATRLVTDSAPLATRLIKQAVLRGQELPLACWGIRRAKRRMPRKDRAPSPSAARRSGRVVRGDCHHW